MRLLVLAIALLAVSGCVNHAELIRALANDPAAFCLATVGTYGGGMVVPAPAVPMIGARASLIVGRSNNPAISVSVKQDGCTINATPPK